MSGLVFFLIFELLLPTAKHDFKNKTVGNQHLINRSEQYHTGLIKKKWRFLYIQVKEAIR